MDDERYQQSQKGNIIPVEITVFEDRSFTFITKTPPASRLILKHGFGKLHRIFIAGFESYWAARKLFPNRYDTDERGVEFVGLNHGIY